MKQGENMMNEAINTLLENIKTDYVNWCMRATYADGRTELSGYYKETVENFDDNIEVRYGNKYIKIIRDRSVWGFVVNTDNDKKFRKGDILKAAGYNAPERNKPRGNILDGDFSWVMWTGPKYL